MGVSLYYVVHEPLNDDVRSAIQERLNAEVLRHTWWSEPINVREVDGELRGATKIFLPGYSTDDGSYREVEPEDDSIMAWRDSKRILTILADLARSYALAWEIEIEGVSLGTIAGDANDQEVLDQVDALLAFAGADPNDPELDDRIADIDRQHADR